MVSAYGKVKSSLYIVLLETGGKFGPRIYRNNETAHMPQSGVKLLLILDACQFLQTIVLQNKDVQIATIPKKTTNLIQLFDVYGFRIWKHSVKTFYN